MPLQKVAAFDVGVGIREKEVDAEVSESGKDAEKLARLVNVGGASDNDVDLTSKGAGALRVCLDPASLFSFH